MWCMTRHVMYLNQDMRVCSVADEAASTGTPRGGPPHHLPAVDVGLGFYGFRV